MITNYMIKVIFQMFTAVNAMFGREKLSKIWAGFTPVVLLFQPEAIECLLSNTACTQKSDHYRFLQPWLGLGLVTSNNGKWKQRRKMLTPTFHFRILQDFMPIFNEHANLLVRHLDEIAQDSKSGASARDNEDIASTCRLCSIKQIKLNQESNEQSGRDAISSDLVKCACQASVSHERSNESIASDRSVDVIPIMTRCTLEVICETAMGIRLQEKQSSKEEEYVKCLHQISKLIVWRITRPWFWNDWMYRFTSEYRQFHACLKVMKSFTRDVIRQRKMDWEQKRKQDGDCSSVRMNETRQRLVFLDLLLQHHFRDPNAFTIEDIREEVDTFMFAVSLTTILNRLNCVPLIRID